MRSCCASARACWLSARRCWLSACALIALSCLSIPRDGAGEIGQLRCDAGDVLFSRHNCEVSTRTRTHSPDECWPCKSNPVRLGSYVSRALARWEIAGFRPGFWPQGQDLYPSPSRAQARLSPCPHAGGSAGVACTPPSVGDGGRRGPRCGRVPWVRPGQASGGLAPARRTPAERGARAPCVLRSSRRTRRARAGSEPSRSTCGRRCWRFPASRAWVQSRSSTRRRARSGTMSSQPCRKGCAATTSERQGSWVDSTSTSSCCSTNTGSSAVPTASTCCRSRRSSRDRSS